MTNVISMPANLTKTAVLAVSGDQAELDHLRCLFAGSSWALTTAATLEEARKWLSKNDAPVLLCESSLPDGEWRGLAKLTAELPHSPSLIVMSRLADERLWSDVLNWGGYDVLSVPLKRAELFHTLSSAWRSWKDRFGREPVRERHYACSG